MFICWFLYWLPIFNSIYFCSNYYFFFSVHPEFNLLFFLASSLIKENVALVSCSVVRALAHGCGFNSRSGHISLLQTQSQAQVRIWMVDNQSNYYSSHWCFSLSPPLLSSLHSLSKKNSNSWNNYPAVIILRM